MKTLKKVLFVTYYWPPAGGVTINRLLRFYKFLPEFGWEPVILTVDSGDHPFSDASQEKEIRESTSIYKTKSINLLSFVSLLSRKEKQLIPYNFTDQTQDTFKSKILKFLKFNAVPDTRIGWSLSAIKEGVKIIQNEGIDLIFSSSPPQTNHIIASQLAQKCDIPWVADLRDPWSDVFWIASQSFRLSIIDKLDRRIEKNTLNRADHVVTVTPSWVRLYQEKITSKISLIYNGYDPELFKNEEGKEGSRDSLPSDSIPVDQSSNTFHILYAGSMSYEQKPDAFFQAIKRIQEAEKALYDRIQITFMGNYPSFLKKLTTKYELGNKVQFTPFASMEEAIAKMKASNMLILVGFGELEYGVIHSKIYDYMASGTPILAFGVENDVQQILKQTGTGEAVSYQEPEKAAQILMDLMTGKRRFFSIEKEIQKFDRKAQTQQLAQIFDDVWNRRNH